MTIGATGPSHYDPAAAHSAGYADVVAPPNMLAAIVEWGVGTPEAQLQPDGTPHDGDMPLGDGDLGLRVMGAGEEMELVNPVTAGTRVVLETTLEAVTPKQTRSGPCVFVTTMNTFTSAQGAVLHRNHFDEPYAREEGHDGVALHSHLRAALALRCVTEGLGPGWRVTKVAYRLRKPVYAPAELAYTARVTATEGDTMTLELIEQQPSGEVGFEGTVSVGKTPGATP